MNKLALAIALSCAALWSQTVQQENAVVKWNQTLLALVRTPGVQPATIHPTRSFAVMHAAIYDAVNSIDGTHQPYKVRVPVTTAGASQEAAADAAAYNVLIALYPASEPGLETIYRQAIAMIGNGAAKDEGISVGEAAANEILNLRAADNSADPPPSITLGTAPGDYQSTPPNFPKPAFTGWSKVTPFVLTAANQFRPAPPPSLTSPTYTDAFNEVRSLGIRRSIAASADQQLTGWFWNGPIQNYWNEIAQQAAVAKQLTIPQTARLFALLNFSIADSVIAFYDAKYIYRFWRPITAIRASADAGWLPETKTTAADPSYPGAHAAISSAGAAILKTFFGSDDFDLHVTSEVFAGVQRNFHSFSDAAEEATLSRIFSGQHFRFDLTAGQQLGAGVAEFTAGNALLPVVR